MRKIYLIVLICISSLFSFEVQKPQIYDDQNISGWLMSEKLDGIRGYWDGEKLYSKNGNPINPPVWFTANFPPFPLDGELWSKRDDVEAIQATVLDAIPSKDWETITYNIFEVPEAKGDFLLRLQKAKEWFATHPNSHVNFIEQIVCEDEEHLQNYLDKIVAFKGEGVIVKNPNKPYQTGRSSHILKVKIAHDMEGVVVGYKYDTEGKLKSLKLEIKSGIAFYLGGGLSDQERLNPPKIGEMITFKYYGLSKNGVPKFASFLRIRKEE